MSGGIDLLSVALEYRQAGRSVLPIQPGSKAPAVSRWKPFQTQRPTEDQLRSWFAEPRGIALVCGPISGAVDNHGTEYALEIIDIDDVNMVARYREEVERQGLLTLFDRLPFEFTPRGRAHIGWLCDEWAGNLKLAQRQTDTRGNGLPQVQTLIETRGEGGYCVVAPTPPGIHPDPECAEQGYVLQRGSWTDIPIITPDDRRHFLDLARSLTEYVPSKQRKQKSEQSRRVGGTRPGDDLNAQADREWWRQLLTDAGWELLATRADGTDLWKRPGKTDSGVSATWGACGELFYVFSSQADPFEPDTAYTAFAAYTTLHHGGDWGKAARALNGSRGRTNEDDGEEQTQQPPDGRPEIRITVNITDWVDQGIKALCQLGGHLYQRDGQLVAVQSVERIPRYGEHASNGAAMRITLASPDYIVELGTQAATWLVCVKKKDEVVEWAQVPCPLKFVKYMQGRMSLPFSVLTGITTTPTLRGDGSILDQPGYDSATGLFYAKTRDYPDVPSAPTWDDARASFTAISEVFEDFPFLDDCHHSAAVAAVLSIVCRHLVRTVPLFAVRSNVRGSGKGLLVSVVSMIATGRDAPKWDTTDDDEEERKRLLTVGLDGDQVFCLDNVVAPLGSAPLNRALTEPFAKGRILGKSESAEVELACTFFATGNHMTFRGDMARRVIPIDLAPNVERPEERTDFRHSDLLAWVSEHHPRLLVAALTLLKAYIVAGRPQQDIAPYGSFTQWSDLIRSALVWIDAADPNLGRQDIEAQSDQAYEDLHVLFQAWKACYPVGEKRTLKEIFRDIEIYGSSSDEAAKAPWLALQEALRPYDQTRSDGTLSARSVGKNLPGGPSGSRIIHDLRLVSEDSAHDKVKRWSLVRASKG